MAQSDSGIIEGGHSVREVSNDGDFLSKLFNLVTLRSPGKSKGKQVMTPTSPSSSSGQYSARTERLIQMRSEFSNDLQFEIESSKEHWSELSSVTVEKAEETVDWMIKEDFLWLRREDRVEKEKEKWVELLSNRRTEEDVAHLDRVLYREIQLQWDYFFRDDACWRVGRKIAEGAQAYIYEAIYDEDPESRLDDRALLKRNHYVFKVFKEGMSVLDILKIFEKKVITGYCTTYTCPVWNAEFLSSSKRDWSSSIYGYERVKERFAIRMQRYWGDLRKLMDWRMRQKWNMNGPLSPYEALRSMEYIAKGMRDLHNIGILHRDLKASNVFVEFTYKPGRAHYICSNECKHVDLYNDAFDCRVGDFECSRGVVGTGFWRAPEILLGLKNCNVTPDLFTQKSDVYSYGMTCYEILTGKLPLENVRFSDYDFVLEGGRPKIPRRVDLWIREMLERCWHPNPSDRPSFQDLCDMLERHIHKRKWI